MHATLEIIAIIYLTFFVDETLHILNKSSGAKWLARSLKTGKEGHIPCSYVIPAE